jgi:hypothetical protein
MTAMQQIAEIIRLERLAVMKVGEAREALEDANRLAKDLKSRAGEQFVCHGTAYRFDHRAIGFLPGNRDWLVLDNSVRVIQ